MACNDFTLSIIDTTSMNQPFGSSSPRVSSLMGSIFDSTEDIIDMALDILSEAIEEKDWHTQDNSTSTHPSGDTERQREHRQPNRKQ